jgi:plasmid stability protein
LITFIALQSGAGHYTMASITIRNLVKAKLRLRAARHGRSMEEEAREILRAAVTGDPRSGRNLYERIRQIVEPYGGIELDIPPREPAREPPLFNEERGDDDSGH